MSEWLTTGEMIDQLQVGEIAESKAWQLWVKRTETGLFECDDKGSIERTLKADEEFLTTTWRIVPQYVSFEEAIKARKEGKGIKFHRKNETIYISSGSSMKLKDGWLAHLTLDDLIKGDWTIEK